MPLQCAISGIFSVKTGCALNERNLFGLHTNNEHAKEVRIELQLSRFSSSASRVGRTSPRRAK